MLQMLPAHIILPHLSQHTAPFNYIATIPSPLPMCRSVVKDTSSWNNKKELLEAEQASVAQLQAALAEVDEVGLRAKMQEASRERDEAAAACTRCGGVGESEGYVQ